MAEPTEQPISYGDVIRCSIAPAGDVDFFRFLSTGNERVVIQTARTAGSRYFEPCFDLISPSLSTLTACAFDWNTFRIGATLNEPGLYTIRVGDYAHNDVGDYTLVLDRTLPSPSNARSIEPGETLSDRIDPVGDLDLFAFDGVAGSTVAVTATRTGGSRYFEPCVYVIGPDTSFWYDCRFDVNTHTVQVTLPLTGTYVVAVDDYVSNNPGDYTLTLGCLGGPCAADQASITVPAGAPWVDSGIDLSGGRLVAMRASASWQTGPASVPTGPMGAAEPCASCPIDANRGALLARIGAHPPFFIGEAFGFLVSPAWSGRLQFQINDDVLGDNTGSATVHVVYSSPPLGVELPDATGLAAMLGEAAPNPFVESTRLRFALPEASTVDLMVYDMTGRRVRAILSSTPLEVGEHSARWDGRGDDGARQAPGVYFYSLKVGGRELTRRAILLR
jgi:hypothetical protein